MLKIILDVELHAFTDAGLCDEYFEEPYGLYGKEVMLPLVNYRTFQIDFEYGDNTTMECMVDRIKSHMKIDTDNYYAPLKYSIVSGNERYFFDFNSNFQKILNNIYSKGVPEILSVYVLLSCNAGKVDEADGLRYYIRSHEGDRHNEPHVHVLSIARGEEASISIKSGKVLAGKLSNKLKKKARVRITENQKYFLDCWNRLSDGLFVDINHHFGIINY